MKKAYFDKLPNFLDQSPTAWHAVANIKKQLDDHGFQELKEKEAWSLKPQQLYYTVRNGSSLIAFQTPKATIEKILLAASHTDSPALKLRPKTQYFQENMVMLGVEVYGGPLLASWVNRDLGIAGRVFYLNQQGAVQETLVNIQNAPLMIPQLAIHLDRQVNENGLILNKQEHLSALLGLKKNSDLNYFHELLKSHIEFQTILGEDLFLYPLQKASYIGLEQDFLASYRIDSLASVHAILEAFFQVKPSKNALKMIAFWDNEEVGSETAQGANSPFFSNTLERIFIALNQKREQLLQTLPNSLCLSVDLAHGLHPNHRDKHDPRHQVFLGKGIVIKSNAQQRYASNGFSTASIVKICHEHQIPFQHFTSRGDIPCGSTIGPIHAHLTGMPTVDIGIPQLSMHSSREIMAMSDQADMTRLIQVFLNA